MKLVLLCAVLAVVGCGTNSKQPFFKPEMNGAVYAASTPTTSVGDPTADEMRSTPQRIVKLPLPNLCFYTLAYGWTCTGDLFDEDGLQTTSDQAGGYYCAKRITPVESVPTAIIP